MRRCVATIAVSFVVVFVVAQAQAAPDAADVVRGFYATLLQTMQHGPALGASGRYDKLEPVVRGTFDVAFMTRLAVGPSWGSLSPARQQQVSDAFERYIAATYADRFGRYSGQKLEVIGERVFGPQVIVETRIVKSNGHPVAINYLMHREGEDWLISDVYLDGTISELTTSRSEFSSILRDRGVSGLIDTLNRKTASLSAIAPNRS
jgi:phospholipid transport system substrate-binding protein